MFATCYHQKHRNEDAGNLVNINKYKPCVPTYSSLE